MLINYHRLCAIIIPANQAIDNQFGGAVIGPRIAGSCKVARCFISFINRYFNLVWIVYSYSD